MKKILSFVPVLLLLHAAAFAAVIEDWGYVIPEKSIGTYADTKGSKIEYTVETGPGGTKAVKLTSKMVQGGWCGTWHNIYVDLSGNKSLRFRVRSNADGQLVIALTDGYDVQYTASFLVSAKDWTNAEVPLSSFKKNPYYTAPDAAPGHPMDLTTIKAMGFSPQIAGDSVVEIGPVESDGNFPEEHALTDGDFSAFNLVRQVNADFSRGREGWVLWNNQTGKGEFNVIDGRGQVKITDPGTLIWSLGLSNPGVMIEKDKEYKIEFEARSTQPMNLKSLVMLNREPFTEYSGFRYFKLTEKNEKYSYNFIMRHDTDRYAAFAFEFGGQAKSTITLGNVKIYDAGKR